jgi:hypothetical protein
MAARATLSVSMISLISVTPAATTIMVAVAMTVATYGASHDFADHLATLIVADLCLHKHVPRHISDRQRGSGADQTYYAKSGEEQQYFDIY